MKAPRDHSGRRSRRARLAMNWVDEHVPTFFASLPVDRVSIVFLPAAPSACSPKHKADTDANERHRQSGRKRGLAPGARIPQSASDWKLVLGLRLQTFRYPDGAVAVVAAAIRELALFVFPRLLGPGT